MNYVRKTFIVRLPLLCFHTSLTYFGNDYVLCSKRFPKGLTIYCYIKMYHVVLLGEV